MHTLWCVSCAEREEIACINEEVFGSREREPSWIQFYVPNAVVYARHPSSFVQSLLIPLVRFCMTMDEQVLRRHREKKKPYMTVHAARGRMAPVVTPGGDS